jgi:hypothetical protein
MDRRGANDRDIFVTSSDDGALTWTTPVRINDDPFNNGRDQFHPWLTVDNQGVVSVVFLDRRHDPANQTYHCYVAQSFDGGATWEPNSQVSTEASDPAHALRGLPPAERAAWEAQVARAAAATEAGRAAPPRMSPDRAGLLGEYIGIVAWDGRPMPVWTDIRNQHQDVFAGFRLGGSGVIGGGAETRCLLRRNPVRLGELGGVTFAGPPRPAGAATLSLAVLDLQGRVVRTLSARRATGAAAGESLWRLDWDGCDRRGAPLTPGVYFLRPSGEAHSAAGRLVLID